MAEIEQVARVEPPGSADGPAARERCVWAWVGLVASAAILWYRWRSSSFRGPLNTEDLLSTRALLHSTNRTVTLGWLRSWAELLAPLTFVVALVSRSVVVARVAAAITAQAALMVVYMAVQRYTEPPWLEWWFYGAIVVLVVSSVVVLRVGRVAGSPRAPSSAGPTFVGARSTAILSVLCGAVLLFLPALLFGEVVRSHADEDDTTSRRLAAVGTIPGAVGLAIALGYLIATTQRTD